jgi:hypothetical protein
VKHPKVRITSISCGLALLAGAGVAAADPIAIITTPEHPNELVGSDTLNQVMDITLASLPLTQINDYNGLGSSAGERALAGSPNAGEPTCTPNDPNGGAEGNPGCQEISAMSRHMQSNICEDDADDPRIATDSTTVNDTAEGLAICTDGLSVITNNAAHRMFGADQAACDAAAAAATSPNPPFNNPSYAGTGRLRFSGTLPSGYVISDWKDVLRLIYTGCRNDQGNCSAVDRLQRCSAATNPVRAEVINNWALMVESGAVAGDTQIDCNGATANACTELRKAYRRDDASGTTGVFLELLGVAFNVAANLTGRARWTPALGQNPAAPQPIVGTHSFCDGGHNEGFALHSDLTTRGDPITKPCRPEDDICGPNGQMGVVRAIRSPQPGGFPPVQCTRGRFARKQFLNTSLPLCPDGTKPSAGQCKLPYFAVDRNGDGDNTDPGDRDFNCLNDLNSRPSSVPLSTDGRSYNFVWRDSDGNVMFIAAGLLPETASWRENQGVLDVSLPVPGGAFTQTCVEEDSTRQQGCLVANTQCTIGWAGREIANQGPFDDAQEPFTLSGIQVNDTNVLNGSYPFARDLFLTAIGGFENITADCVARGGSAAFCQDELTIANEFYNMGPVAQNACLTSGFIPKVSSECRGAQATAGCGAPTVQAKTACLPQ